jgi:hypothetical protein
VTAPGSGESTLGSQSPRDADGDAVMEPVWSPVPGAAVQYCSLLKNGLAKGEVSDLLDQVRSDHDSGSEPV